MSYGSSFFLIASGVKLFFLVSELKKRMEILLYFGEFEYVPFYGHVHIFIVLNSTKMYIALRDALKIMVFLVAVSLLLVHQLCVAETAIVGKLSLPPSVAKYLLALYDPS